MRIPRDRDAPPAAKPPPLFVLLSGFQSRPDDARSWPRSDTAGGCLWAPTVLAQRVGAAVVDVTRV